VLFALCVGEVGAVVDVDCETEFTFIGAEMGFDVVGVFGEVDGFEGEATETFSTVHCRLLLPGNSSSTELGSCSVLIIHVDIVLRRFTDL